MQLKDTKKRKAAGKKEANSNKSAGLENNSLASTSLLPPKDKGHNPLDKLKEENIQDRRRHSSKTHMYLMIMLKLLRIDFLKLILV